MADHFVQSPMQITDWRPHHQNSIGRYPRAASYETLGKQLRYSNLENFIGIAPRICKENCSGASSLFASRDCKRSIFILTDNFQVHRA